MKRFGRLVVLGFALAAGVIAYERFVQAPSPEALERLRGQRRTLEDRLEQHLTRSLGGAPDAGLVVGVPPRFAQAFVEQAVTAFVKDVGVALRGIEVRREGDLHGRILVGRTHLGRYALHITLDRVDGRLAPGRPRLGFGGDRVTVSLPVAMSNGTGHGRLRFEWDGRGVAGAVCGDVDVEGEIAGTVAPAEHRLEGAFRLSAQGATIVAQPEFEDVRLVLAIQPSPESWQLVDDVLARQNAICRKALAVADVRAKVSELVERGIAVTLPKRLLPEIRFPAGIEAPLAAEGASPRVRVTPVALRVTPAWLWYGAEIEIADLVSKVE